MSVQCYDKPLDIEVYKENCKFIFEKQPKMWSKIVYKMGDFYFKKLKNCEEAFDKAIIINRDKNTMLKNQDEIH